MPNHLHLLNRISTLFTHVHSIDFHDCVFNLGWLTRVNAFNTQLKTQTHEVRHAAVMAESNEALLAYIKKATELDKPESVTFMLGSACQSYLDDYRHRIKGIRKMQPISVFEGLQILKQVGSSVIDRSHTEIKLDPYLLADSFDNLPAGTSFSRALQAYKMGTKGIHHANWVLDDTKMLILYAQVNRAASFLSNTGRLKFHFYDDKKTILDGLANFYSSNQDLIPRNTTLILSQYGGTAPEVLHEVTGTASLADANYHRSVQKIVQLCGYEHDFTSITRMAKDFTPRRVEAFKSWRNLTLEDKFKLPSKTSLALPQLSKNTTTAAFFKKPPIKEIIRILSFDFDKCLYNDIYLKQMRKCLTDNPDMTWGEFLEVQYTALNIANGKLFLQLADDISKINGISQVHLILGTGRQSYKDDMVNRLTGPVQTGSSHQALLIVRNKLEDALAQLIKGVQIKICYLLLADIYAGLIFGSSYRMSLAQMHKDATTWRSSSMSKTILKHCDEHPTWIFDDSKLTLIYAHLHHVCIEQPNAEITYAFYDDRIDILKKLQTFLSANLYFIPKQITVILNQYDGGEIKEIAALKGTGLVDFNFDTSIKKMVELSGHSLTDYDKIIDVLTPLSIGNTMVEFQQWQKGITSYLSYGT